MLLSESLEDRSETPRPATTSAAPASVHITVTPSGELGLGTGAYPSCRLEHSFGTSSSERLRVFKLPFTDFVTCLHINSAALVFGTVFGKVVHLKFDQHLPAESPASGINAGLTGTVKILQAFSEDAVRAVYSDELKVSAVIGNTHAVEWNRSGPSEGLLRFDRRVSQQMKYVLPHKEKILVASTGVTLVFDARESQQWLSPLRLPDVDVVPLDFKPDRMIAFVHKVDDVGPAIKVLRLPLSQDEPPWGVTVECIFHQDLPRVTGLAKAAFWGDDWIAFVANGRHLYVFNLTTGHERHHWRGFNADVCAMDTSHPGRIVTITERSTLQLWKPESRYPIHTVSLEPSRFTMGNPYFITSLDNLVVYSADEELSCIKLPAHVL